MPDSIDDLALRWKKSQDAPTTIALCGALRGSVRTTLAQQVADFAQARYASNVPVLLAVARMYISAQKLAEAQSVLVAAGKIAPREGDIYRVLGEVLLRRGDAERAEKVFERALQFGVNDDEARTWMERAKVFRSMQAKAGARAVAAEVARVAPVEVPPARPLMESFGDAETAIRAVPASLPPPPRVPTIPPPSAPPRKPSVPPPVAGGEMLPPPLEAKAPPMARPPSEPLLAPEQRRYPVNAETQEAFRPAAAPVAAVEMPSAPVKLPAPEGLPPPSPFRTSASPGVPDSRDVLDALSLAGVFEKPSGPAVQVRWDRPDKTKRRGTLPLLILTMFVVGGGIGGFFYIQKQRQKAHTQAEATLASIETDMQKSQASLLPNVEKEFSTVFELDSRSDRAALDWLHERALTGLLKGGADVAFEEGITRAHQVKVKDELIAFAQIASFLFQGDTVGAASLLSKWDGPAQKDPWYQLMTGAALERAGDPRAASRYEEATKLDPELVIAQVGLARATAIDGDPQKAMELARAFRAKWPDRIEGQALVGLAWARDPQRGDAPPEVGQAITAKEEDLPVGLRVVPHALLALQASDKHDYATTKAEVQKGLAVVDGPGVASWLGAIALATGDEELARKAALAAVGFSAVYPPARVLAARVALLGDRLDEALKATEELDANSPDVAVVRAAAAYERIDATALGGALEAVPADSRKLPFLASLTLAQDVLAGRDEQLDADRLMEIAGDDAPWSDFVAMDAALDTGDMDTAHKMAESWKGTEDKPLRALRLSRLARFDGKLDDADHLSQTALEGTVTTRVLAERVFVLVARNRPREAGPLLARYPLVLGPLQGWLSAYASASAGKVEDARGKTASLDPPPELAPVPARLIAAAALGAMKDRHRGPDYVKALYEAGLLDPDVTAAGEALGLKAPPPRPPPKKKKK